MPKALTGSSYNVPMLVVLKAINSVLLVCLVAALLVRWKDSFPLASIPVPQPHRQSISKDLLPIAGTGTLLEAKR